MPQIVKTLLAEHNVQLEDQLTGDYRLWGYCVQYNESSFNFISRLMELEGIYYYFKHEMGKHTLVLGDAPHHHQPYPGYEMILPPDAIRRQHQQGRHQPVDVVRSRHAGHLQPGRLRFPQAERLAVRARQNPVSPTPGQIDVYDWPGRYTEHQQGEFYARVRREALAGRASADPGHRHRAGHRPRQHLYAV